MPETGKFNFDQWNWFFEQQTGRVGPDPNEVGVQDRLMLMTRDEWWEKVKTWYFPVAPGGGGGLDNSPQYPGIDPPATGGNGAAPPSGAMSDQSKLILAGVAVIGLILLMKR